MILMCLLLALIIIQPAVSWGQQELCTGFASGTVSADYIHQEFGPAVVKVGSVGTAHGYLLTAKHVLGDLASKHEPQHVIMQRWPHAEIEFTLVKNVSDVALLQLVPPNAMHKVRAFDISFSTLGFTSPLFAMGFPVYGDQAKITLREGEAKFAGSPQSGVIEITHPTFGGDSGGVLVDDSGDAVAVCDEKTADGMKGRYIPLAAVSKLFDGLPVSDTMRALQARIVNGSITEDELDELFAKNTRGLTNLELYVWLQSLSGSPDIQNKVAPYANCPFMSAFYERHIPEAIRPLIGKLSAADAARMKLVLAQKEYSLGFNEAAAELARESANAAPISPASNTKTSAVLLEGAIQAQNNLGGATVLQQDDLRFTAVLQSGKQQDYLAQWTATIEVTKSEIIAARPVAATFLRTALTGECHWQIKTAIQRRAYYLDDQGKPTTDERLTKLIPVGSDTNHGPPQNCHDLKAQYEADLKSAASTVNSQFSTLLSADRNTVVEEVSKFPDVKGVLVEPAPPKTLNAVVP